MKSKSVACILKVELSYKLLLQNQKKKLKAIEKIN